MIVKSIQKKKKIKVNNRWHIHGGGTVVPGENAPLPWNKKYHQESVHSKEICMSFLLAAYQLIFYL